MLEVSRCRGNLQAVLRTRIVGEPLADIAISGLPGWVAVSSQGRGEVHLQIWAPAGIQAFVRPPLPCPEPTPRARMPAELAGL